MLKTKAIITPRHNIQVFFCTDTNIGIAPPTIYHDHITFTLRQHGNSEDN